MLSTLSGSTDLMWLGLGTTLGVAVQFLCLLPSLFRSDLWRLTFRFNLKDPALRAVGRLGSWTLLVVLLNQLSLSSCWPSPSASAATGRSAPTPTAGRSCRCPTPSWSSRCSVSSRRNSLHVDRRQHRRVERATAIRTSTVARHHHPVHARAPGARAADRLDTGEALQRESPVGRRTVLAVLAAGLPGFTIFQLVCAACSRCNVRARSSISTRFKMC